MEVYTEPEAESNTSLIEEAYLKYSEIAISIGKELPISLAIDKINGEPIGSNEGEGLESYSKRKPQIVCERLFGEKFNTPTEARLALVYAEAIGFTSEIAGRDCEVEGYRTKLQKAEEDLKKIDSDGNAREGTDELFSEEYIGLLVESSRLSDQIAEGEESIRGKKQVLLDTSQKCDFYEAIIADPFTFKDLFKATDKLVYTEKLVYIKEKLRSLRLGGNERVREIKTKVEEKLSDEEVQKRIVMLAPRTDLVRASL